MAGELAEESPNGRNQLTQMMTLGDPTSALTSSKETVGSREEPTMGSPTANGMRTTQIAIPLYRGQTLRPGRLGKGIPLVTSLSIRDGEALRLRGLNRTEAALAGNRDLIGTGRTSGRIPISIGNHGMAMNDPGVIRGPATPRNGTVNQVDLEAAMNTVTRVVGVTLTLHGIERRRDPKMKGVSLNTSLHGEGHLPALAPLGSLPLTKTVGQYLRRRDWLPHFAKPSVWLQEW